MLSDHERETLQDMEQQLRNEDPGFARAFRSDVRDLSHHPRRWMLSALIVMWAVLALVSVGVGAVGSALACTAVTAALAAAWHWREHLTGPGNNDPEKPS